MRAIVCEKYGAPANLRLKQVKKPIPNKNQVLIKVKASAINDYDWCLCRGKPYLYRLVFGFRKPKHPILGMEFSGIVEGVGEEVKTFSVGDEVYGDTSDVGFGTFADFICLEEQAMRLKPPKLSFEMAAAIPHAFCLAFQGLVDKGKIREGHRVLINGAGGGVGTLALQVAKTIGAEVHGVDT